jgi:hypothetical protein
MAPWVYLPYRVPFSSQNHKSIIQHKSWFKCLLLYFIDLSAQQKCQNGEKWTNVLHISSNPG